MWCLHVLSASCPKLEMSTDRGELLSDFMLVPVLTHFPAVVLWKWYKKVCFFSLKTSCSDAEALLRMRKGCWENLLE